MPDLLKRASRLGLAVERLIARLDAERRSVPRIAPQRVKVEPAVDQGFGGAAPQPAE